MNFLIQQTRHLLEGEIIKKMYPAEVLTKLVDDPDLDENSANEFISYRLQDAFIPWPLNYLHITILGIIGLFLMKIFFDPYGRMLHSDTRQQFKPDPKTQLSCSASN